LACEKADFTLIVESVVLLYKTLLNDSFAILPAWSS
jgi:hypothetical protein